MRKRTVLIYAMVLIAALWLNSTFAQTDYETAIYAACAREGCDGDQLVRVMYCESEGDPTASHPNPYGGTDEGLFQINSSVWGVGNDPYDQINFAAMMFGSGQGYHWVCQ